jgi:hypothetical protein
LAGLPNNYKKLFLTFMKCKEVIMPIKVLIKRQLKEGAVKEMAPELRKPINVELVIRGPGGLGSPTEIAWNLKMYAKGRAVFQA